MPPFVTNPPRRKPPPGTQPYGEHMNALQMRAFFPMAELSGSTYSNFSRPIKGTLAGTTGTPTWGIGRHGPCLSFVRASVHRVALGSVVQMSVTSPSRWTVLFSCNAKWVSADGDLTFAILGSSDTNNCITMRPNVPRFSVTTNDYSGFDIETGAVEGQNSWAIVRDGSAWTVYKNGVVWGTASLASAFNWTSGNFPAYIGGDSAGAGNNLSGDVDYVAVLERAMTAAEVASFQADPFASFYAPSRLLVFPAAAGAPPATTNARLVNAGLLRGGQLMGGRLVG